MALLCFAVCSLLYVLCFVLCLPIRLLTLQIGWCFVLVLCFCYVSVLWCVSDKTCFMLCFFSMFLFSLIYWFVFCYVFFYVFMLFCNHVSVLLYVLLCWVPICFPLYFCWVSVCMFCDSTKFALPLGNPSNLPTQLAIELGSLQLYSVLSLLSKQFFFHVSTTSIAQTEKTSSTNTGKLKRMLWPLDSASSEYGPVRPLPPVPWCEFSAQAPPSMTPVWKPLEPKEIVSTEWANLGDRS